MTIEIRWSCDGMTEREAVEYVMSIFSGTKVDWQSLKEGYINGTALLYNDNTVAYLYRTKTKYVVRFDRKGDKNA